MWYVFGVTVEFILYVDLLMSDSGVYGIYVIVMWCVSDICM